MKLINGIGKGMDKATALPCLITSLLIMNCFKCENVALVHFANILLFYIIAILSQ